MLNFRLYAVTIAALVAAGYGWGLWQHHTGWADGRDALRSEQAIAAEKLRQENAHRQHVIEAAAAEADRQGEAKTVTITREVVKYVQTPGRTVCRFDDARVQLKARAVANANTIPGFDAPAVPDVAAGQ